MGEMADYYCLSLIDPYLDDYNYIDYHKPSGSGPCPKCGAETVLRAGKFGNFYGCTKYPDCKGSRNE